jgi:hypothetical protein
LTLAPDQFATIQTFHCKKLDHPFLFPLERTTEQEEAAFPNVVPTIFSSFGGRMIQLFSEPPPL